MKQAVIRLFTAVLAIMLVLGTACASTESAVWACPSCGTAGNTGNFCSNCGTARPAADWACVNCGAAGNTGNFCINCGAAKPDGNTAPAAAPAASEWLEQIPGRRTG